MKRIILAIATCFFMHGEIGAKDAAGHAADILDCLFGGTKNGEARELVNFISQGMDMGSGTKPIDLAEKGSSFLNTLRNDFGGTLKNMGKHRELGHWALDGAIPKEYLQEIDELAKAGKLPSNAREILIGRWREFVATRTEAVKQVFGLSGPGSDRAARAFASIADEIHNLGDYMTKDPTGLRKLDDISNNLQRSLRKMLGNHNEISMKLADELSNIPKTLPNKVRAQRILEVLKKYSPEISQRIGRIFQRYGFSGTLRAMNYAKLNGFLNGFRKKLALEAAKACKNLGMTKCIVQEEIRNGVRCKVIRKPVIVKNGKMIPVEDYIKSSKKAAQEVKEIISRTTVKRAANTVGKATVKAGVTKGSGEVAEFLKTPAGQGVTAGVISFVINEGSAIIDFSNDKIAEDQFAQLTAFNMGKAGVEGGAIYGISVMLAGAPVWLSVGAMIGAGILIDKGGEYIWVELQKSQGVLPGVTDADLLYELPENVRKRKVWTEELDPDTMRKRREGNLRLFDKDNKDEPWKDGRSFY